jgi:hypothetical protein
MAFSKSPRVMQPSVQGMTVQQERACLCEIRQIGTGIDPHHVLENGMMAGDFALKYISGHHKKRQEKHKKKLTVDPTTGKLELMSQPVV